MIRRRQLFAAILLSLVVPLPGASQGFISGPAGLATSLYWAIETGDVETLSARLTEDFRFDSDDPQFREAWPAGMDHAAELNFVKRLSESVTEIQTTYDRIVVDPPVTAMQEPSGTYRVRVSGPVLRFTDPDHGVVIARSREHVFQVICVQIPVGEFHVTSCRVRRWAEFSKAADPSLVTAAAADSSDSTSLVSDPQDRDLPDHLDLRVLANGRHDAPSFSISLPSPDPATLEMFDVAGRRVDSRDLSGLQRGTHTIGIPAQLANGVYWARLHQGASMKTARVVVLR